MFELIVDLVLLGADRTGSSGAKMYWWGLSEMLKRAEAIKNVYGQRKEEVPRHLVSFVKIWEERDSILQKRLELWPSDKGGTHPNRWTGSASLPEDASKADRFSEELAKKTLGYSFDEYYRALYPWGSWAVHSSALEIGSRDPEELSVDYGLACRFSASFAMLAGLIFLNDFAVDEVFIERAPMQVRESAFMLIRQWSEFANSFAKIEAELKGDSNL